MKSRESTLLEREEPLRRLETALGAARRGQGRILSVEGEAGIGKTTLTLSFAEAHRADAQVLIGGCEHLVTPEPLGPLRDIARESQGRFTVSSSGQLATFESLLRLLTAGRDRPALLIIEDIHWADDSTLDLLRYLGRRIRSTPILAIVTFRNDEAASQSRLAALYADLPRDCCERLELLPLSAAAVSQLAGTRMSGGDVFDATGGNPFHVTEYLATPPPSIPHGVRDATLARASRLSSLARRTLDCASIFPRQIDEETLFVLAEDRDHVGIEECLRGGMLKAKDGKLAFRHELARRAIHDAMAPLHRRNLHAAALAHLQSRPQPRAAACAHHAQHAGAIQELVTYSIRAANEAAALGAHRESLSHIARALEHGPSLSNVERADLLEQQAVSGELCGAFDVAMTAIENAIAARKRAGDILGLGNALCVSARLYWQRGQAEVAEQRSQEALAVLHDSQDSWQYAMALSGQSQLDMLADRLDGALSRAAEAMERAERLGRSDIYLHALTNSVAAGCAANGDAAVSIFLAAIDEANRRQEPDFLPRLYVNLVYTSACDRLYAGLFDHLDQGIAAAAARDNVPLEAYMRGVRASALLDLGRTREALAEAEAVLHGPYPTGITRFTAQIAAARARLRLGLPDDDSLELARGLQTSQRDIMRMGPIAVADAEALWLGLSRPQARERLHKAFTLALRSRSQPWQLADTALWLTILGEKVEIPADILDRIRLAPRLHISGAWREAAAAWADLGCPYEQAIALSMGDEAAQREALGLFDNQGAAPAAARLRQQMRARGARAVPRGPIGATRANPAGLTRRQGQVLTLVSQGLNNTEIAARLHISAKTAEHHVSAIMALFNVRSRGEAAEMARTRGLLGGAEK